jgi:hypothetical protein
LRWRTLATVTGAAAGDSIGRWNGRYVLLHDGALVVVEADGAVQRVSIDALLRPAMPMAREPNARDSPGLANREAPAPAIWALYADDTGASVLHFATATEHGLVDLATDPPRILRCRLLAEPTIGVIRDRATFVAVLQDGSFVRLQPSGSCDKLNVSIRARL